jgi:hypothetical protein
MARANKQKRHERRFGKPYRLADVIAAAPFDKWAFPKSFKFADEEHIGGAYDTLMGIVGGMSRAKIFDATNVAEYAYTHDRERTVAWENRVIKPPFDEIFIEARSPGQIGEPGSETDWPELFPSRFGFYIQHAPKDDFVSHWREMIDRTGFKTDGGATAIVAIPVMMNKSNGAPCYMGISFWCLLDRRGCPVDQPITSIDKWHAEGGSSDKYKSIVEILVCPIIYALMFLNCGSVKSDPVEPNLVINRERRNAGLKPFLRYRTINIDPMKEVLRTEGNIEADGLRKALHRCRGHFATYTDSIMGRKLESPITVWKPPHVRGTHKQGVVISDYKVNAPAK